MAKDRIYEVTFYRDRVKCIERVEAQSFSSAKAMVQAKHPVKLTNFSHRIISK